MWIYYVLVSISAFSLSYVWLLKRDFILLNNHLVGITCSGKRKTKPIRWPFSHSARDLMLRVEALDYRIGFLDSAFSKNSSSFENTQSDSFRYENCTRLLQDKVIEFADRSLATYGVIIYLNPSDQALQMVSNRSLSISLKEELEQRYGDYIKKGEHTCFGRHDSSKERILPVYGIWQIVVAPIMFIHEAKEQRWILWFGYSDRQPATELEVSWSKRIASELAVEVQSMLAMRRLTEDLSSLEAKAKYQVESLNQITHDIRSPINNIIAVLKLLQFKTEDSDAHECITLALRNCDQLHDVLNELLEEIPSSIPFEIGRVVLEVFERYEISAQERSLRLSIKNSQISSLVDGKERDIKRILENLVSNAIKYTTSGEIVVEVFDSSKQKVLIRVSDTGCGMTEKQISELFTPFTRFQPHMAEGKGLGLSIAHALAIRNSAVLRVDSTEGKGSTFEFELTKVG